MIALVDYGAGNVSSVRKALEAVGAEVWLTSTPNVILAAEKVVLPGVGAFGDCMNKLHLAGLVDALRSVIELGKPFLGICVGMQVLFEESFEMGRHEGLGFLRGRVVRFGNDVLGKGLKVPHTGWNQIKQVAPSVLLHGLPSGAWVYFNHAYYCEAQQEDILAITDYGGFFPSVVSRGLVYGVQFHPEKSQRIGLQILRNFVERV